MVPLTAELVLRKSKAGRLEAVRNLNCWGCSLSSLALLERLPNLEVLSLSVNSIDSLEWFRPCANLTELYLRKNRIADLAQLEHLRPLRHLSILWLVDNPLATALPPAQYRLHVVRALPQLTKLDNVDVTEDERRRAAQLDAAPAAPADDPGAAMPRISRKTPNYYANRPKTQSSVPDRLPPTSPEPARPVTGYNPRSKSPSRSPGQRKQWSPSSHVVDEIRSAGAPLQGPPVHKRRDAPSRGGGSRASGGGGGNRRVAYADSEARSASVASTTSTNVLTAVLSLVRDLDAEALRIVRSEIDERLTERERI